MDARFANALYLQLKMTVNIRKLNKKIMKLFPCKYCLKRAMNICFRSVFFVGSGSGNEIVQIKEELGSGADETSKNFSAKH